MLVAVLGPLEIDGRALPGGRRDRMVLSVLAVQRGATVSPETLAEAVWPLGPPPTWPKGVQGTIVRLRRLLGTSAIASGPGGYRLTIDAVQVDAEAFEQRIVRAAELRSTGAVVEAYAELDAALALWRGTPFPDVLDWEPARGESARLDELRELALEQRLDAGLQRGRSDLVAEARRMLADAPHRERRWLLLATALYGVGRQVEALETLRDGAERLADDHGLDPSPGFAALEVAILRHDPALTLAAPAGTSAAGSPRVARRRRPRAVVVALVAALTAVAAITAVGIAVARVPDPVPSVTSPPLPVVYPDEEWLVFTRADDDGLTNIFLARPDGSDQRPLLADRAVANAHVQNPEWSPAGDRIAYEVLGAGAGTDAETPAASVWITSADGTGPIEVAGCSDDPCRQYSHPTWSPDGDALAMVRFDLYPDSTCCESHLVILDLRTGSRRTVFEVVEDPPPLSYDVVYSPTWSPDGREIAFALESYGLVDPYPFIGSRIAIVSAARESTQSPRFVTEIGLRAYRPDWHPASDLIVFSTADPQQFPVSARSEIFEVRSDGSGLRALTDSAGDGGVRYLMPSWRPDGTGVLLSTGRIGSGGEVVEQLPSTLSSLGGTPAVIADFRGNDVSLRPTG